MKRKNIFFTLGLSLAMGLGVVGAFAGARTQIQKADAATLDNGTVVYLNCNDSGYNWADADANVYAWVWYNSKANSSWETVSYDSVHKLHKFTLTNTGATGFTLLREINTAPARSGSTWGTGDGWNKTDVSFETGKNLAKIKVETAATSTDTTWGVLGNSYGLIGSFNSWSADIALSGDESSVSVTQTLAASAQVKVRFGGQWFESYGYDQCLSSAHALMTRGSDAADNNMIMNEAGDYTFTLNLSTHKLSVMKGSTTYTVAVYVDGVKRGDEVIGEGLLPEDPALTYGKEFSGWYDDPTDRTNAHKVTAINSNTSVWGDINNIPTVTYTVDLSLVASGKFSDLYIYQFEVGGEKVAWPGEELEISDHKATVTVPNDATIIFNEGSGAGKKQTVNITQSGVANDTLFIKSSETDGKYNAEWRSEGPADEGYYIFGSVIGWTWADAIKMTTLDTEDVVTNPDGNCAKYITGLTVVANEQIRIRSYWTDRQEFAQWADYGGDNTYGALVGGVGEDKDNFKFTVAGTYDLYAKYDSGLKFYVARHSDFTIQMTGVLFNGKVKDTTVALDNQAAYASEDFVGVQPDRDGYVARGIFTDEACTTPYVAHAFEADGHLYVKYTKLAWYVAGDATYSGSEALKWSVDAATIMVAPVSGNLLEGTITIPAGTDAEHPVDVKPMSYELDGSTPVWNGQYGGENLSMGGEYSFVSRIADDATGADEANRGNLRFTKPGTFAIFVNSEKKIYITEGLAAFYSNFISQVGDVCDSQGNTNPSSLAAAWSQQALAYASLSDEDKAVLHDHPELFKHYETPENDQQRMINLYHYILTKYGTSAYTDFIWGQTLPSSGRISLVSNTINSTTIVVLTSVMTVIAGITIAFFVLKKKKEQR